MERTKLHLDPELCLTKVNIEWHVVCSQPLLGKGEDAHNVRLTILETRGEDVVFKGFFNDGDETYFVDPIAE